MAVQKVKSLKSGTLIIQLEGFEKKINTLEDLINSKEISERKKLKLKKDLSNTRNARDTFNSKMISAFQTEYQFSKVLFMFDSNRKRIKTGETKGLFLGMDLEPDLNQELTDSTFYILRVGYVGGHAGSGIEALIISDSKYNDIQKPFPYYYRINSFSSVLKQIFFPSTNIRKDPVDLARKVQKELVSFYGAYVY